MNNPATHPGAEETVTSGRADADGRDGRTGAGAGVGAGRGWQVLALASVAACLAAHVYILWGTRWPAFPFDEVTLLQMSRVFAGEALPDTIRGAGYFPAWAVLIAPVWWFTSDPSSAYQASLWIGVVVSLVTIWPLAALVRRLGLAWPAAVVVGAITMALPARSVHADFSLSERLATLLLVLAVLAAFRVADRPSVLRTVVFAGTLAGLLFAHVRMSVVLIAAAVWLIMRLPRTPWSSTLGLVLVAVAYQGVNAAGRAINESLLGRSFAQGENLTERLANSRPSLFLRVGLGQSWHQSLASYGIVAIGLVVLVVLVWGELRRRRFGGATFLLGAASAMVALSFIQWANDYSLFENPWVRLDNWIYGRYIDPAGAILTAFGLGALLVGLSRRVAGWSVGLNVLVFVGSAIVLTREVPTWGYVTPAHVPGILPWSGLLPTEPWPRNTGMVPTLTNGNSIWIIAPLCVLAVLAVVLILQRRRLLVAGILVALAVVGSILSSSSTEQFHEQERFAADMRAQVEAIRPLTEDEPIGYARDCSRLQFDAAAQNYFGYALLPALLVDVSTPADLDDVDVVIGCDEWSSGERAGARQVASPSVYASRVWVMPGELQDELEAAGRLEAAGGAEGP